MDIREFEIRRRLKAHFPHYAERCLRIRAKDGGIVPFVLNGAQRYIHDRLERQLARTGRVRALVLKGRQQGCSTYIGGRFYWKVTHGRGLRAFILTHMDDASRNVYQIVRRFHDNCPDLMRPHAAHASVRELYFDRLDSGYQIGTAKSQGVGRSNTVQFFHGSEVAYWDNAQAHMAGVLQAVPDMPGTEIVLESTSAGAGNLFHALCAAAQDGRGGYEFIFIPWFWQEEYRAPPPPDFAPDAEEEAYMESCGLDPAQVCWRRGKIAELGSHWTFRREYPMTPQDAFLADNPAALWRRETIGRNRVAPGAVPALRRVVVAIDPAVTSRAHSDETGIVVAGLGTDGDGYVLADLSGSYSPDEWAGVALRAFGRYEADRIVAEVNQGGDMVEHTLRTRAPRVPYKGVRASRGKVARAEPVAALDEQGRVHHTGVFQELEDQMCAFIAGGGVPARSDRADARVWALTELMLGPPPPGGPKVWF